MTHTTASTGRRLAHQQRHSQPCRAAWLALLALPLVAAGQPRETSAQARRIVAQSVCLSVAYPDSSIAQDAAGVVAVYQGLLGPQVGVAQLQAVRKLAEDARPASPTPVGQRNLAIARCTLLADRPDVLALLGARPG